MQLYAAPVVFEGTEQKPVVIRICRMRGCVMLGLWFVLSVVPLFL